MDVVEAEARTATFLKPAQKAGGKFLNPVPTTVGGGAVVFKVLPRLFFPEPGREPERPLGPFWTNAAAYATPPASRLRITWFGHSSSLIEIDGVRLLIDPVWDERASPFAWFGPKRFFVPTIKLERLPRIDAVLLSHDHYDHLGKSTVIRLAQLQPEIQWVTSLGIKAIFERYGMPVDRVTELDWTETARVRGSEGAELEITSLPARHFSGRTFRRMETLWASFVLRGARHKIYYGADSGWWEGFQEIGAAHGPFDLTMLEIGAYDVLWQSIHLGPDGAARAYRALGGPERAGMLMPIHWGLFNLALHAWQQPIQRITKIAESEGWKLWSPEPGAPTDVIRGSELKSAWWKG